MDNKKKKPDMANRIFNTFFSGRRIGAAGDRMRRQNLMIEQIRGKTKKKK